MLRSFQLCSSYSYRKSHSIHFGTGPLKCGISPTPGIMKENKFSFSESTVKLSFTAVHSFTVFWLKMKCHYQFNLRSLRHCCHSIMSDETEQSLLHSSVTLTCFPYESSNQTAYRWGKGGYFHVPCILDTHKTDRNLNLGFLVVLAQRLCSWPVPQGWATLPEGRVDTRPLQVTTGKLCQNMPFEIVSF